VALADHAHSLGKEDWVFVFAGEKPMTNRDLSNIRYVGYVKDPGSALLAADVVVVPNRHTYFDLGVLEAMSVGANVALSPTGGNRHLLQLAPWIPCIPHNAEQTLFVLEDNMRDALKRRQTAEMTRGLWRQRFTLTNFVNNHIEAGRRLLNCTP
jgi:glycosyltransferase involved in cell wall biosynthesis